MPCFPLFRSFLVFFFRYGYDFPSTPPSPSPPPSQQPQEQASECPRRSERVFGDQGGPGRRAAEVRGACDLLQSPAVHSAIEGGRGGVRV